MVTHLFDSGAVLAQHGGVDSVDVLDEITHGLSVHGAERDGGWDLRTRGKGVNMRTCALLLKWFFLFTAMSKGQRLALC